MRPQTVPRGFLRWYVLSMLTEKDETGYSIMQKIADRTDGAWRPGPGTVYPLLRSMEDQGLVKSSAGDEPRGPCMITPAGRKELDELRQSFSSAGRNERATMHLFLGIMPAETFTAMAVDRSKDFMAVFRRKAEELPEPGRSEVLREMKVILENNLEEIDRALDASAGKTDIHGRRSRN